MEQEYEWVSPSEVARREGICTQAVYYRMQKGQYETQHFKRGVMNGFLVKVPKEVE